MHAANSGSVPALRSAVLADSQGSVDNRFRLPLPGLLQEGIPGSRVDVRRLAPAGEEIHGAALLLDLRDKCDAGDAPRRRVICHRLPVVSVLPGHLFLEVTVNTGCTGRRWQGGADRRVRDGPCQVSPWTSPPAAMGFRCIRARGAPWLRSTGTSA